jgi:hypothetical protein
MGTYDVFIRIAGQPGEAEIQRIGLAATSPRAAVAEAAAVLGLGLGDISPNLQGWEEVGGSLQSYWVVGPDHAALLIRKD